MVWGFESPSSHQTIRTAPGIATASATECMIPAHATCARITFSPAWSHCSDFCNRLLLPIQQNRGHSGMKKISCPLPAAPSSSPHRHLFERPSVSSRWHSRASQLLSNGQRHFCAIYRSISIRLNRAGTTKFI